METKPPGPIIRLPGNIVVSREFFFFLLAGGSAAVSQWLIRFPLTRIMPFAAAVALAYCMGIVIAFELNRRFVFPANPAERSRQFIRFVLVNVVSFTVVCLVSVLLGDYLLPRVMRRDWAEAIGHGAGLLSPVFLSYVLHKRFTFRSGGTAG